MRGRVVFVVAVVSSLAACSLFEFEQRPPWRDAANARCLANPAVLADVAYRPLPPRDGPGICGLEQPLQVEDLAGHTVTLTPGATLDCPMVAALQSWLRGVVQPAAMQIFGQPVIALKVLASYGCRSRDNIRGAQLSEHAFGNAIDIGAFVLADGRTISVLEDWAGAPDAAAFLRTAHDGACSIFNTVLGPGADRYHTNHFHLDLARHRGRITHFCQPKPAQDVPMTFVPRPPMSFAPPMTLGRSGPAESKVLARAESSVPPASTGEESQGPTDWDLASHR